MADQSPSRSERAPHKAYYVTLVGRVERDFLVYAHSREHVMEIMRGDREGIEAMDDTYTEKAVINPRRAPSEDRRV